MSSIIRKGVIMANPSQQIVQKLWHYCNVLRDDGLSYPDYVEQLTYLLFLKMAHESVDSTIPPEYSWSSFAKLDSPAMSEQYEYALHGLSTRDGLLGTIFKNARNK